MDVFTTDSPNMAPEVAGCQSLRTQHEFFNHPYGLFRNANTDCAGADRESSFSPAFAMKIFNHILAMDTSPLCRGFCHAMDRFWMTDGKRIAKRAQAPSLLAFALGKSVALARHRVLYTDSLF